MALCTDHDFVENYYIAAKKVRKESFWEDFLHLQKVRHQSRYDNSALEASLAESESSCVP